MVFGICILYKNVDKIDCNYCNYCISPLQVHATILLSTSPVREKDTRTPETEAGAGVPTAGPEPTVNDWLAPK